MQYLPNILFLIALIIGFGFFTINVRKLIRNIKLGRDEDRSDNKKLRWKKMAKIALGQYKMVRRPISGIIHIIVYLGFIVINIELLEILIDGIFGTHRVLQFLGGFYDFLIATFEIFALLVLVGVILFWLRRNAIRIKRFWHSDLKGWSKLDANLILYMEVVILSLFLTMNAADYSIQQKIAAFTEDESSAGVLPPLEGALHYASDEGIVGSFPVSQFISPFFEETNLQNLMVIERTAWWLHILSILVFLNYLYYSKHLHILLAFPNTYFSRLTPQGKFENLDAVTQEVKLMMDPDSDPYAAPDEDAPEPEKFGASDATDLSWFQLLSAYTCTECGRCTSECPANQTGKKLSPRKIMMDSRDRIEEIGRNMDANKGEFVPDGKQLLDDYISREELWACTTCNACVEVCPVGIDPLSIIMNMRQYLVMEQSAAPSDLNNAMTNIENNAAPWPFNQMDRANWIKEL